MIYDGTFLESLWLFTWFVSTTAKQLTGKIRQTRGFMSQGDCLSVCAWSYGKSLLA